LKNYKHTKNQRWKHPSPTTETPTKIARGTVYPDIHLGSWKKMQRKKDPKIFHKRETGDRNPKLFSLQQQSSQNLTLIHTPPKTPSFIKDEGK
jgi:hypothetical protein